MTRARVGLLWLAALFVMPAAEAGRPLITDDAAILDRGTCQLEAFALSRRRAGETGTTRDFNAAPSCNPFGGSELLVGIERDFAGDPDAVTRATAQVKAVPVSVAVDRIGFGGSVGFGQDVRRRDETGVDRRATATAIVSAMPAAAWEIDANLGVLHDWQAVDDRRNHVVWGIAAQWHLAPKWSLVAERFGTRRLEHATQIGLIRAVSSAWTLDAAIARRHAPGERSVYVTVGLTLVFSGVGGPR